MFAKGLMWLIVVLCMLDLALGQEIVEISGGTAGVTPGTGGNGSDPIEVQLNATGRHMQYDIPDDGLLPKWCISDGKSCPTVTPDIGSFKIVHELECMHKCRELSCLSAQHSDGVCTLSSAQCSSEQLVDGPGKFYNRLPASETDPDPACPGGTSPIGIDEEWPTNQYCKGVGVECPGPDLMKFWFRPTARQCLVECNVHPACMSTHYRDKICYIRVSRCTQEEMIARPGGFDFHRLKKGEVCPPERPLYAEERTPYMDKFCMAWGKTCKGYDVYRKPQNIHPFQKCLEKCAKIKSCGSVDFFNNRCSPKEHRCTDEELEADPNVQNFMRLEEGEDCPGNRKPPSHQAPWSERFCLKRDWDCPGYDLEPEALTGPDFIHCLKKCVEATDCESVQFLDGMCYLKSKTCAPEERLPKPGTDMYYRLHEGEECSEDTTPPECPSHSSYMPEHSTCPVTCDNQFPDICDMLYEPGCVCDEGYARNASGSCVALAECGCREHNGTARELGEQWVSLDCDVTYSCELDDTDRPAIVEGTNGCPDLEKCDGIGKCQCVDGYVRKEGLEECQPALDCGQHSSYEPHGMPCFDTCAEPNLEPECIEPPAPVCHCNEGYILNVTAGECVPYRDCGCKEEGGGVIPVDTVWLTSDCGETLMCSEVVDELPAITRQPHECPENAHCQPLDTMPNAACVCNEGWTLHVDGECIPGIECEPPTVFVGQRSSCPSTCRQPELNTTCATTSGAGCQCSEGMLLDDDEDCLPAETCPCYDENGTPKMVGDIWMTNDCSAYVNCTESGPALAPHQTSKPHECQDNAECDMSSGFPQCVCAADFTPADDGVTCVSEKPPCDEELNTRINTFVEDVMSIVSGGCGSCSDTCRQPHASEMCPAGNKLCKCYAENHLYDELLAKCIPANECGCFDADGERRLAGVTWVNNECTKQKTCVVTGAGPPEIQEDLVSCANCDGFGNCLDQK